MSKIVTAIAATTLTAAAAGAGYLGYQQLSSSTNSNTNSNVAVQQFNTNTANTNQANANIEAAKSIKDEVLGTWVSTDGENRKVVITADEITVIKSGNEREISKYRWLSEQEIELTTKNNLRNNVKVAIEGDELKLEAIGMTVKYKRELANAANSSVNADSQTSNTATDSKQEVPQTAEVKAFADSLIGVWRFKREYYQADIYIKFTENKLIQKIGDGEENFSYRIVDKNTIEITEINGSRRKVTIKLKESNEKGMVKSLLWTEDNETKEYFHRNDDDW